MPGADVLEEELVVGREITCSPEPAREPSLPSAAHEVQEAGRKHTVSSDEEYFKKRHSKKAGRKHTVSSDEEFYKKRDSRKRAAKQKRKAAKKLKTKQEHMLKMIPRTPEDFDEVFGGAAASSSHS